MINILKQPRS